MFSCRADMKTFSHYYFTNHKTIHRYENGIYNRNYFCIKPGYTVFYSPEEEKIVYQVHRNVEIKNANKIKQDLENFLTKFYELGLVKYMHSKPNNLD